MNTSKFLPNNTSKFLFFLCPEVSYNRWYDFGFQLPLLPLSCIPFLDVAFVFNSRFIIFGRNLSCKRCSGGRLNLRYTSLGKFSGAIHDQYLLVYFILWRQKMVIRFEIELHWAIDEVHLSWTGMAQLSSFSSYLLRRADDRRNKCMERSCTITLNLAFLKQNQVAVTYYTHQCIMTLADTKNS